MDRYCENCDEPILPVNFELYDKDRDAYYCERCADRYRNEVEEAEGRKMD